MTRRMFSDEITTSDAFLDMPSGSQLLYFHLGMAADDDGFVGSVKMVMRMLGTNEDEYKVLKAKKFVIEMENGVCVIKGWRINNQIRKDRYRETKYLQQKALLFIKENGAYTLNPQDALPLPKGHFTKEDEALATNWQPPGDAGKVRLGKVSLDKTTATDSEGFDSFWKIYPPTRKQDKQKCLKKWHALLAGEPELEKIILDDLEQRTKKHADWIKDEGRFVPAPLVYLNNRRWEAPIVEAKGGNQTFRV